MAAVNFIDMCAVCRQGVSKENMTYQKGLVFHPLCFEKQGSAFPTIDPDLAQLSAKTRVELVQMKNLKARTDAGLLAQPIPAKKKTIKKKAKKSKPKKPKHSKAKRSVKSKKRASKKRR